MGLGNGTAGYGKGGDNSNSGPTGKLHDVKGITRVTSQLGKSGMIFPAGETKGAPDETAPTSVPYTKVYPSYSKAAENALEKEQVPPAYRQRVKKYFSSLE